MRAREAKALKEHRLRSIRLVHITTADSGLRYLLLNQMKVMQASGIEVMGISSDGPEVPFLEEAGFRHTAVYMKRHPFTPLRDIRSLWHLYRAVRRLRPTIVHTHNPKPSLLGQLAARMARVPVVVNTVHGFFFHEHMDLMKRRFFIAIERLAARFSDHIFMQSQEDLAVALAERIAPATALTYIGNGIDLQEFNPSSIDERRLNELRQEFGIPAEARVIGFVGRLVKEKGVLELLAAAAMVRGVFPDIQVLVVGPVDYVKSDVIQPEIAADYGLEDVVKFVGVRHDMPYMYRLMDVFALPSYREGFPRVGMEAAAMGVPSVLTNIRGCREVVVDGVTGILIPRADAARLAEALIDLLQDRAKAGRLAEAARRRALEHFDEKRIFRMILDEYERLLRNVVTPARN